MILSVPSLSFLEELRCQLEDHPKYRRQHQEIIENLTKYPPFSLSQNLVLTTGCIWLPRGLPITSTLLTEYHTTPTGGHAGITKTLARISENFYWTGLREDVKQFVANCVEC